MSWDHSVRPLTQEEIGSQISEGQRWHQFRVAHPLHPMMDDASAEELIERARWCKVSRKCRRESTHMLSYTYITGRSGRSTRVHKPICEHHAKKYQEAIS